MTKKVDFEHALTLLTVIVEAGKHGPLYQKLASLAGEELKEIMREQGVSIPEPRVITPPAGPADGAIQHRDGSITERPTAPLTPPPVRPTEPNRPTAPSTALGRFTTEPVVEPTPEPIERRL